MLVHALAYLWLDLAQVFAKVVEQIFNERVHLLKHVHRSSSIAEEKAAVKEILGKSEHAAASFDLEILPYTIASILLLNESTWLRRKYLLKALVQLV